jgi:integrase
LSCFSVPCSRLLFPLQVLACKPYQEAVLFFTLKGIIMRAPLRRALKRAGICREHGCIGWHDLRHTYASHLVMKGVPLTVVKELMGHATIDMTERYAHLSPDIRREAVAVLDRPLAPGCDIHATRLADAANHP